MPFCHNCGKSLTAGAKFCSSCGTNLSSLSSPPPARAEVAPPPVAVPQRGGGDDDDDMYIDHIQHLDIRQNALQVEIIRQPEIKETIKSAVMGGLAGGPIKQEDTSGRPIGKELSSEEVIKQFQKEAGTMRNEK